MNVYLTIGAILAGLGVAAGAFGAHALENRFSKEMIETFQVGVRYHLIHALGIVALSIAGKVWPDLPIWLPAGFFVAGILIFSGSLYVLVLTGHKWLGMITPIGGIAFLIGWFLLAWNAASISG